MALTKKNIKNSLLEQLEKKDCLTDFNIALVDDFIYYHNQERKCQKRIKDEGYTITATSAQGKTYDKENPCIKASVMFNKQKLSILKQLGLNIDTIDMKDDSDDIGL